MGEQLIKCYAVSLPNEDNNYNQDNIYMNGKYILNEQRTDDFSYSGRYRDPIQIFAISDGFGHGEKGATASTAVMQILKVLQKQLNSEENLTIQQARKMISDFIVDTNNKICLYKEQVGEENIGTTFAALFIFGNQAFTVHVGDSRIYRFKNNQLQQITKDHLECESLVKLGILSKEQAMVHKVRSKLTKYFGYDEEDFALTATYSQVFNLEPGDLLFLTSDGITDQLENQVLHNVMSDNNKNEVILTKSIYNELLHRQGDTSMLMLNVDEVIHNGVLGGKVGKFNLLDSFKKNITQESSSDEEQEEEEYEDSSVKRKIAIGVGVAAVLLFMVVLIFALKPNKDKEALSEKETEVVEVKPDPIETVTAKEPEQEQKETTVDPQPETNPEPADQNNDTSNEANEQTPDATVYAVQQGDNLFKIVKGLYGKEQVPLVRKIAYLNKLEDPAAIFVGQQLQLPPSNGQITYIIEPGDTIYSISMAFFNNNSKELEIIKINQIEDINDLIPGQSLIIP